MGKEEDQIRRGRAGVWRCYFGLVWAGRSRNFMTTPCVGVMFYFLRMFRNFTPPPPEQDEESTKLSGRIVVRIIFDHAATQHSKMKIRLTMHAAYSSPGAPMQEARKILLAAWGDSQDSPAVGGGIGIR